jgi:sugar-specific transcriptional regulator TrmB
VTNLDLNISKKVEDLQKYGLTERQAQLYIFLIIHGPMKLGDIVNSSGLNKMLTYRTLKKLVEVGFVQTSLSRPTFYSATHPKEALSSLIEKINDDLIRKAEEGAFLLKDLISLAKTNSSKVSTAKFKIIQGRKQVFKTIKQMSERARFEENAINTANGIIRCISSGLSEFNENAAKRGVKLRWIAPINAENFVDAIRFCECGEVRNLEIPSSIRFIVMDESETLISSISDDSIFLNSEGDIAIWTNDRNISKLMNFLFQNLWKNAKPIPNNISDLFLTS